MGAKFENQCLRTQFEKRGKESQVTFQVPLNPLNYAAADLTCTQIDPNHLKVDDDRGYSRGTEHQKQKSFTFQKVSW